MDKSEWLKALIKNIENYDQYKIINIDSRCYNYSPCSHNVIISYKNQEYEVLLRGDEIGYYQKYHGQMSLHFMNYISNEN